MRGERHIGHRLLVRRRRQAQFEHTDRLPPVSHRREHASSGGAVLVDLDRLAGERAAMRCSGQGHALGAFPALGASGRRAPGVVEADQRPTAEVRDQEGDSGGAERVREPLAQYIGSGDRRGVLDVRKQLCEVQPRRSVVRHARTLRNHLKRTRSHTWTTTRSRVSLTRLARAHPSGGTVIERAAIVAEGANSEAVIARVPVRGAPAADENQPSTGTKSASTALLHPWKAGVTLPLSPSKHLGTPAGSTHRAARCSYCLVATAPVLELLRSGARSRTSATRSGCNGLAEMRFCGRPERAPLAPARRRPLLPCFEHSGSRRPRT